MLPVRHSVELSRAVVSAAHSGVDRLSPPISNQPGTRSMPPSVAHTLCGVWALPVQYSEYPVYSSASADTSGVSRHGVPTLASEHCVEPLPTVLSLPLTPGPTW